jgi:7,8-dihydroneopterin aldolase/epimerase/oxygenase
VADTVSIKDLRVSTVIGVHDWERETEQILVFAVDMATDVAAAAATDNLAGALDYSAVVATVRAVVTTGKFQLIETAAEQVAERLRTQFRLGWVRVQVAKPLHGEGYTAVVTIERGSQLVVRNRPTTKGLPRCGRTRCGGCLFSLRAVVLSR